MLPFHTKQHPNHVVGINNSQAALPSLPEELSAMGLSDHNVFHHSFQLQTSHQPATHFLWVPALEWSGRDSVSGSGRWGHGSSSTLGHGRQFSEICRDSVCLNLRWIWPLSNFNATGITLTLQLPSLHLAHSSKTNIPHLSAFHNELFV